MQKFTKSSNLSQLLFYHHIIAYLYDDINLTQNN